MGTINLGPPPVGENSRFELEVRLDPDNGCRIVPRVGEGEMEERDWERSQNRRPKVSGVELESREEREGGDVSWRRI